VETLEKTFTVNLAEIQGDCAKTEKNFHLEKGLVHVYYGDGRGKTSIALGTALRACGHGMRVKVVQLLKGISMLGECKIQNELAEFEVKQFGTAAYVFNNRSGKNEREKAAEGIAEAVSSLKSGEYDVVIIDEAIYALEFGIITLDELLRAVAEKPDTVELILTGGRNPPKEILDVADYVSHVVLEKHPYNRGISARRGIDF
jgi:cob(I)alamin adenosyltransferase